MHLFFFSFLVLLQKICGTNYPLSISFIVVNEFCERFSYYGMKGNEGARLSSVSYNDLFHVHVVHITWNIFIIPWCSLLHKAVLTLYFIHYLHWSKNFSTAIYHAFSGLCYFTPVIGALIADSWLGKFKYVRLAVFCLNRFTRRESWIKPDNKTLCAAFTEPSSICQSCMLLVI